MAGAASIKTAPAREDKAAGRRHPAAKAPPRGVRRFGSALGISRAMHGVFDVCERLARTNVTVTLLGETGTGKDVIARALHERSGSAGGPFVVFDCGAVPPNLAESELFGHDRGSFTGAVAHHAGAFERAQGGTLFLDEVGELPLDLQPKLLRVLENRSVRRVGGAQDRPLDVRVVAATNCNLAELVSARQFREDLYFRLAAAVVTLPAVCDRLEDLPCLVVQLLTDLGRPDVTIAEATWAALRAHSWPGNVRELKNTLACGLAFVDAAVLEPGHLRIESAGARGSGLDRLPLAGLPLARLERAAIAQTLARTGGNKAQAAKVLGVAVSTLYEKLRKHPFLDAPAPAQQRQDEPAHEPRNGGQQVG